MVFVNVSHYIVLWTVITTHPICLLGLTLWSKDNVPLLSHYTLSVFVNVIGHGVLGWSMVTKDCAFGHKTCRCSTLSKASLPPSQPTFQPPIMHIIHKMSPKIEIYLMIERLADFSREAFKSFSPQHFYRFKEFSSIHL